MFMAACRAVTFRAWPQQLICGTGLIERFGLGRRLDAGEEARYLEKGRHTRLHIP